MKNLDIRKKLKEANIKQWELADKLIISEMSLVRKLRYELTEAEKRIILKAIDELAIKKSNSEDI